MYCILTAGTNNRKLMGLHFSTLQQKFLMSKTHKFTQLFYASKYKISHGNGKSCLVLSYRCQNATKLRMPNEMQWRNKCGWLMSDGDEETMSEFYDLNTWSAQSNQCCHLRLTTFNWSPLIERWRYATSRKESHHVAVLSVVRKAGDVSTHTCRLRSAPYAAIA